jgi:ATP-dependent DNA helicase PIF1
MAFDDNPTWTVIDVETTGLDDTCEVIEVGVVHLDAQLEPQGSWSTLIRPNGPLSATEIHGITETDLMVAPPFAAVVEEFSAMLRGVMVGHNVAFDLQMLCSEFNRVDLDFPDLQTCDTRTVAASLGYRAASLQGLVDALDLGLVVEHRALADAWITVRVWQSLLTEAQVRGMDAFPRLS